MYTKMSPNDPPKNKKEAPMAAIDTVNLGKAKKQRDQMRNRIRTELNRFSAEFGISQFEVTHAVLDSLLLSTDQNYGSYGSKPEMKYALAQTLLPSTLSLIGGSAPTEPVYASPMPLSKKEKAIHTTAIKPDKYVTEADVQASVYYYTTSYKEHKEIMETLPEYQKENYFFVRGHAWAYTGAPMKWFNVQKSGNYNIIIKIPKNSPYVSDSMLSKLNLQVPSSGFKWRKLKNKAIYKLQDYSKGSKTIQAGTNTTASDAWYNAPKSNSATDYVTAKSALGSPITVVLSTESKQYTYPTSYQTVELPEGYMWLKNLDANQVWVVKLYSFNSATLVSHDVAAWSPPPEGWHWETYGMVPSKAILGKGDKTSFAAHSWPPKDFIWPAGSVSVESDPQSNLAQ